MKASGVVRWWLLFTGTSVAMPGVRRRQAQTSSDICTCPANGPVTTTIAQYTVITYSTTVTTQDGTAFTTDPTTEVVTVFSTSTVTITTDTTTITYPGVTRTTTTPSTTTSTITETVTQTSCIASRKLKRQATFSTSTSGSDPSATVGGATGTPSVLTTIATSNSKGYTCVCRPLPQTTVITSSSTCSCPATTDTTITFTEDYTSSTTVSVINTTPTVVTVTSSEITTTTISSFVTSAELATVETTDSSVTLTSETLVTEYTTSTATVFSCPPTTSSSSTTTLRSSTSSTSSSAAVSSSAGSLSCNSTAYLIGTSNSVPKLYNIDLRNSASFVINGNVGNGKYSNINAMGYNVLDNFLYAIATISTSTYAVIRITATGSVEEVLQFTSSTASPGTSGDIDTDGQFWFCGSAGTVWRQVDLAPGSSTYGTIVASGTSTLTGYAVYDWVYLPGQGAYQYSLATSTDSTPNYAVLRWGHTTHAWSVYQEYADYSAPNPVIANWAASNATIWGLASTSGQTTRVTLGGTPVVVGTAPSGITSADGARCALAA